MRRRTGAAALIDGRSRALLLPFVVLLALVVGATVAAAMFAPRAFAEEPPPAAPPEAGAEDAPEDAAEDASKDGAKDAAKDGAKDGAKDAPKEPDQRPLLTRLWEDKGVFVDDPKGPQVRLFLRGSADQFSVHDDDYTRPLVDTGRVDARGQPIFARGGRLGNTRSGEAHPRIEGGVEGRIKPDVPFTVGFEATPDTYGIRDVFLDTNLLALMTCNDCTPTLRIGNFIEPIGLEQNTPGWHRTFLTRSAASETFGFGHSLGVMAHQGLYGGRLGYALGYFYSPEGKNGAFSNRQTDQTVVRDGHGPSGRLWWMPSINPNRLCHRLMLAASVAVRTDMSGIQLRSRPESYTFGYAIDTDFSTDGGGVPLLDDADSAVFMGVEASWVRGRWFAQAEYFASRINSTRGGDPTFHGGYVMAGLWLTGECRRLACGALHPSRICRPVDPCEDRCARGGLELAARFTHVDLNDGNIAGGTMNNLALELNWWLRDSGRLMFSYIRSRVDDGTVDEPIHVLQMSVQFGL